jgi:two-component system, chemotaxis family, sensor kinase CheA
VTEPVDLKEFLSAYLAEVEEQLQGANARLLEIEAYAREGKANPRSVRHLFRALHTIKGLSAMVGVEPAVAIAHRMETVLRVADTAGGLLALASVDVLLQGIRAIEHRVREISEHKDASPAPRAILEALDQLEPSLPVAASVAPPPLDLDPAIATKLASFEVALLVDGARGGRRAVRVDFTPSPARAARGLSINTVRERVGSIAEIVKVVPRSVPATDDAPGGLTFAILLLTSVPDDDVANAAGVAPETVRLLVPVAPLTSLGSAAPAALAGGVREGEGEDREPVLNRRNIVRVEVSRLDDAMEHLSTLVVTRSRLARVIAQFTAAGVNTRELVEIARDHARQLRDLRAAILRVRMVPVGEVLDRIPLLLRGLRRESGKQVRLALDVGNAELDKGVAERLFPAIVHLVRNAVDHAIETPSERVAAGKPEEGTLRIAVVARSNTSLELKVSDDGRGIDRASVARRSGRDVATDGALLDALCRAGFSTRDEVTTTSGRGMGMDIVKRIVVDQLGGELAMTTGAGVGTTFTLRVPLSISIVDTFTMECRDQRFVVPVSTVEEIFEIDRASVRHGPSHAVDDRGRAGVLERRGEAVPLLDLASVLRLRGGPPARQAMLVRRAGEPMAFGLDRVVSQQEAVVRPLLDPLVQAPGVSGATDLGDGKPTLVLDLLELGASLADGERAA